VALLKEDQLFTTRDLLSYGNRAAIDQVLYRMVKLEILTRLARGVFIKYGAPLPTKYEIAKVKAEAFGKKIYKHCSELADLLNEYTAGADWSPFGMKERDKFKQTSDTTGNELILATSGCSSSFKCGNITIKFKSIAKRKLLTGESRAGILVRSIWHLRIDSLIKDTWRHAFHMLDRFDIQEIIRHKRHLPGWLNDTHFSNKCFTPLMKHINGETIQPATL
jgi:hypothetical protein